MEDLLTVDRIAAELNITKRAVYQRIARLQIQSKNRVGLQKIYNRDHVKKIEQHNLKVKLYPLKTTETFYIYESKLNTM